MNIPLNAGDLEIIIQGGMGAGVSDYQLARTISLNKCLGVVSGTALNEIMVRRLQTGDKTGEIRDALSTFPDPEIAARIIEKYFIDGGKDPSEPFEITPFPSFDLDSNGVISLSDPELEELIITANFVEVSLAKKGHNNPVGINYLHKIQWPLMPSIYGAMLADVDYVLIGAGLPREVASVLDKLSHHQDSSMVVPVEDGEKGKTYRLSFNPKNYLTAQDTLKRPIFLGIVANHLGVKGLPDVDGYVFEKCDDETSNQVAGGHNPPARESELNENGEPNYTTKDAMNYKLLNSLLIKNAKNRAKSLGLDPEDETVIKRLKQPYWFAGGYADKLQLAIQEGATGVQVGTVFAFCVESGVEPKLRRQILEEIMAGGTVFTSPIASPSGYPFKVFKSQKTVYSGETYSNRRRVCNLGYLSELYLKAENKIGLRCPAEPSKSFWKKGGDIKETEGRVCLCNALVSTIGLGSPGEPPIVTTGSDLRVVKELVKMHGFDYKAKDVIDYILRH